MTTPVLGAGEIDVTTAYYLAQVGHKVVVLRRQPGAGSVTTFANAARFRPE